MNWGKAEWKQEDQLDCGDRSLKRDDGSLSRDWAGENKIQELFRRQKSLNLVIEGMYNPKFTIYLTKNTSFA